MLHGALPVLPALPEGEAPEWLHLVPAGAFRGAGGEAYVLRDAARVIAATGSNPLVLDLNHATDLAAPSGGEAPAMGWITALQARTDGIWGRVDWTRRGRQAVVDREYRAISPVIVHAREGGEVLRILRASLVNNPNLPQLATLHSRNGSMLQELRRALGLADDADEAAVLAAVRAGQETVTAHAADVRRLAAAAGVAETTTVDGLVTSLQARTAELPQREALAREVTTLNAQVTELRNGVARTRAEAFVDAARRSGKPISELMREHYVTRHMANAGDVEKEINAMVSLHAGGLGGRDVVVQPGAPSPEDATTARILGLDPVKLAAHRAGQAA